MGTRIHTLQGAVAETLSTLVDPRFIAHQCVVSYYPDGTYTPGTEVTPSDGAIEVKGRAVGSSAFDVFADSPLIAAMPTAMATARGILNAYEVVPTGIVGATHYRVTFVASETN